MAFSCGARSPIQAEGKDYLRYMLSRRQLQSFVLLRGAKSNKKPTTLLRLANFDSQAGLGNGFRVLVFADEPASTR